MTREEEKKILSSYPNLLTWIDETKKGNFMKAKYYAELFYKVMNEEAVYCKEIQLKSL